MEDELRRIILQLEEKLKEEVRTRIENQNDLRKFMSKLRVIGYQIIILL